MELAGVLDNVRSRYNVGAIFRTADGLGIARLYLCGITPRPDRRDDGRAIAKTALGAEQSVPWEYVPETIDAVKNLKRSGVTMIALETGASGTPLERFTSSITNHESSIQRIALVVGHEVHGVAPNVLTLADHILEIPMRGTKDSLNVEVAFAIAAYTLTRKVFNK